MYTTARSILVYTADPWENVITHLRIRGPAEHNGTKILRGNQGDRVDTGLVQQADLVIIQRDFPRFWTAYEEIASLVKNAGKPLVYEIDDLLFELPEDHSHRQGYTGALAGMLAAAFESDLITVSSATLGDYLRELNPNVCVLPNYLDDRIWEIRPPKDSTSGRSEVVIGYMGGETHLSDLEVVAPVLLKILGRYAGKVRLRFWGGRPPDALLAKPSTEWTAIDELDYRSFASYFSQQDCDIAIAPLRDSLFNRAKSGIKYLEYSALGFPGVYSRLAPYQNVVEDGVNGFLASSDAEWETALGRLIESPELRAQIANKAQESLEEKWLLSGHAQDWNDAYASALSGKKMVSRTLREPWSSVARQSARRFEEMEKELIEEKNNTIAIGNQLKEILESRSWRFIRRLGQLRINAARAVRTTHNDEPQRHEDD